MKGLPGSRFSTDRPNEERSALNEESSGTRRNLRPKASQGKGWDFLIGGCQFVRVFKAMRLKRQTLQRIS